LYVFDSDVSNSSPNWGSAFGSVERSTEIHVSVAVETAVWETTIGIGGAELSWLLIGETSALIGTDLRISARGRGSTSNSRCGADLCDRAAGLACGTFIAIWASDEWIGGLETLFSIRTAVFISGAYSSAYRVPDTGDRIGRSFGHSTDSHVVFVIVGYSDVSVFTENSAPRVLDNPEFSTVGSRSPADSCNCMICAIQAGSVINNSASVLLPGCSVDRNFDRL
jgi:hypothetical protein